MHLMLFWCRCECMAPKVAKVGRCLGCCGMLCLRMRALVMSSLFSTNKLSTAWSVETLRTRCPLLFEVLAHCSKPAQNSTKKKGSWKYFFSESAPVFPGSTPSSSMWDGHFILCCKCTSTHCCGRCRNVLLVQKWCSTTPSLHPSQNTLSNFNKTGRAQFPNVI